MGTQNRETDILDPGSPIGLEAFSSDKQFIGRVMDYLPQAPADEQNMEEGDTDTIDSDGRPLGKRRVRINGAGTILQCTIVIGVDVLEVDTPGRRVTVPLTVAEMEAMPHYEPMTKHHPET